MRGIYRHKETGELRNVHPYVGTVDEYDYFPCKFSAQDYNFVAKRLRENFPIDKPHDTKGYREESITARTILSILAVDFAKSYVGDNPRFDPLKFLDACSPDTDRYPLSKLWDE